MDELMNEWVNERYAHSHVRINNNKNAQIRRIDAFKMQYQLHWHRFCIFDRIKCTFVRIIFARKKNALHLCVAFISVYQTNSDFIQFHWVALSFGRSIIKFRLKSRLFKIINRHCQSCYSPLISLSLSVSHSFISTILIHTTNTLVGNASAREEETKKLSVGVVYVFSNNNNLKFLDLSLRYHAALMRFLAPQYQRIL